MRGLPTFGLGLLLAVLFLPAQGKLHEEDFARLMERIRLQAPSLDDQEFSRLLQFSPVNFTQWRSPNSLNPSANSFSNKTFVVVVYHVPPYVVIQDKEAVSGDPGNVNRTRSPGKETITGLTIDLLREISKQLGCSFEYIYPCRRPPVLAMPPPPNATNDTDVGTDVNGTTVNGTNSSTSSNSLPAATPAATPATAAPAVPPLPPADAPTGGAMCVPEDYLSSAAALQIVQGGPVALNYYGVDANFCKDNRCFAAGALKISDNTIRDFFVTQPFSAKGFRLLVKNYQEEASLMSWAGPFDYALWLVVVGEIVCVALVFMVVEGYGINPSLPPPTNRFTQFFDCIYWSLTIVLTVSDKQPQSHAGRTLCMAQLFFSLLLIAVYTGNLNAFLLNTPTYQLIDGLTDLTDRKSPKFAQWRVCVPEIQTAVRKFLDLQESLSPGITFNRVSAPDIVDCMFKVYKGEADTTLYDEPVLLYQMANTFYNNGLCGYPGGYCSDLTVTSEASCNCPVPVNGVCGPTTNVWTPVTGSLVTTGEVLNPFGYAFAFHKGASTEYMAFSQVVQYLKEQSFEDQLESIWIPSMDSMTCGSANPIIQLGLSNLRGMILITGLLAGLGMILGLGEHFINLCIYYCPCCKKVEEEQDGKTAENPEGDVGNDAIPESKLGPQDIKPPPKLGVGVGELSIDEALLELQVCMDRIEDLLIAATADIESG